MYKSILIIGILAATLSSQQVQAQDAKAIAFDVYNRETPKDGESDMTMTLIDKRGSKRMRNLHQYFMNLGEVEKKIMFFTTPADVKNTSFMNWSYDDAAKEEDQWLYLPALKKVKRISASSKDNEFMGSDFTYEDMEKRNPERDNHIFLKNDTYNGEAVWVIQATPKKEEQYSKKVAWISKEKKIPLKIEFYDIDEELLKVLTITEVVNMKGYWLIVKQEMKNIQKNHMTIIALSKIQVDKGLTESKFTQREMEKGL